MTTAVMYDSSGFITAVRTGRASAVEIDAQASGQSYLLTEDDIDLDRFYVNVSENELVEYPSKPSEAHVFNFTSASWELDLTEAKALAWNRIKRDRDQDEFGEFVWNTHTFQCDEVSQRRIQGAVQLAQLDSTTSIDWTLADNSTETFNSVELKEIGQALAAHVDSCHVKARGLRNQINAAQNEAELELITW